METELNKEIESKKSKLNKTWNEKFRISNKNFEESYTADYDWILFWNKIKELDHSVKESANCKTSQNKVAEHAGDLGHYKKDNIINNWIFTTLFSLAAWQPAPY